MGVRGSSMGVRGSSVGGTCIGALRPGPVEGTQSRQESTQLSRGQRPDQDSKTCPALLAKPLEDSHAGLGAVDLHDASIDRARSALDQPTLLHPIDYPGRAGDRDVKGLGQPAHRLRTVGLQDRQDVKVDEAQGAAHPRPECTDPFGWAPRGHLLDDLVDESGVRGIERLRRVRRFIQWHMDNLA